MTPGRGTPYLKVIHMCRASMINAGRDVIIVCLYQQTGPETGLSGSSAAEKAGGCDVCLRV